ncbi:hupothetical protein [Streptococcus pyogenes]|nr:hupothetical protein [Streptococcus pyogenes]
MIDLKRNLFKIDVRAQKDEEKVFMRTAWLNLSISLPFYFSCVILIVLTNRYFSNQRVVVV